MEEVGRVCALCRSRAFKTTFQLLKFAGMYDLINFTNSHGVRVKSLTTFSLMSIETTATDLLSDLAYGGDQNVKMTWCDMHGVDNTKLGVPHPLKPHEFDWIKCIDEENQRFVHVRRHMRQMMAMVNSGVFLTVCVDGGVIDDEFDKQAGLIMEWHARRLADIDRVERQVRHVSVWSALLTVASRDCSMYDHMKTVGQKEAFVRFVGGEYEGHGMLPSVTQFVVQFSNAYFVSIDAVKEIACASAKPHSELSEPCVCTTTAGGCALKSAAFDMGQDLASCVSANRRFLAYQSLTSPISKKFYQWGRDWKSGGVGAVLERYV
jgi:hypothetical protein